MCIQKITDIILSKIFYLIFYYYKLFYRGFEGGTSNRKNNRVRCIILKGETTLITFSCIKCGHSYNVPDEYAGKKVRCKECQTINSIPGQNGGTQQRDCEDSIAAYNNLLNELLRYEKQSPVVES